MSTIEIKNSSGQILNKINVEKNENFLDAIRRQKINIEASCGGHASCGDCVVVIKSGAEHLTEMEFDEKKILGNVFFITKERLACQTCFKNDDASASLEIKNSKGVY
jgi:2Fe-2S ferredoxin